MQRSGKSRGEYSCALQDYCVRWGLAHNPVRPKNTYADHALRNMYRGRHLPKPIYKANHLKRTVLEARRVKEERRRKHTRAGEAKPKAEKKTVVVREQT